MPETTTPYTLRHSGFELGARERHPGNRCRALRRHLALDAGAHVRAPAHVERGECTGAARRLRCYPGRSGPIAWAAGPLTCDQKSETIRRAVRGIAKRGRHGTSHRSPGHRRSGRRNLVWRGAGRSATEQRAQLLRIREYVCSRGEPRGISARSRWSLPDRDPYLARQCQLWGERFSARVSGITERLGVE